MKSCTWVSRRMKSTFACSRATWEGHAVVLWNALALGQYGAAADARADRPPAHKIRLPVAFAVLAKVFTDIDGICRQLDPDFDFTEVARPYVGRAVRSELHSENTLNELYRALVSARSFLFSLPEHLDRLMRKLVDGTLRVEFRHQNLEEHLGCFPGGLEPRIHRADCRLDHHRFVDHRGGGQGQQVVFRPADVGHPGLRCRDNLRRVAGGGDIEVGEA